MKLYKLYKLSKILLALLFLLTVSINMSSAAGTFNTCPGEPRNLSWTSANSGVCNGVVSGANSNECAFNPNPNVAGNRSVSINSLTGTCNATISCTNAGSATAVSDTTTLNVVNKASCCGTGSQTNQPNAYTDPSSGFRCNCPAGTYNNGANTCTTLLATTVTATYSGLDHPLVTPSCPTPLTAVSITRNTGSNTNLPSINGNNPVTDGVITSGTDAVTYTYILTCQGAWLNSHITTTATTTLMQAQGQVLISYFLSAKS